LRSIAVLAGAQSAALKLWATRVRVEDALMNRVFVFLPHQQHGWLVGRAIVLPPPLLEEQKLADGALMNEGG
jgi:hypothetical protein